MTRRLEALLVLSLCLTLLQAEDHGGADEYEIKAAMLLNLTKFVQWPAAKLGDASGPFVIGVLGRDPFGRDLDQQVAGKTVNGHPVVVQRLNGTARAEACHILFITRGERRRLEELGSSLAHASVLTVGDGDRFAEAGSVVGLVLRGDRVQLEVNLAAAQRNGLTVSSRLLKLANVIKEGS
ncbi:MAG: YfiR family protein [Acidobacteria bacterium]|nr:YfiR family protein [Acidobacteriota bacterium]